MIDLGDPVTNRCRRIYIFVVMDHQCAIASSMDVELDCVGAQLDGTQKGREGVFRERLMCSAVGDFLGAAAARSRQASPGVVALGTVGEAMNVILPGQLLLTRAVLGRLPDEAP
jgi:hypothetical protein